MSLQPGVTGVLKKRVETHKDKVSLTRYWNDASSSRELQGWQETPEARSSKDGVTLYRFQRKQGALDTLISEFWPPEMCGFPKDMIFNPEP